MISKQLVSKMKVLYTYIIILSKENMFKDKKSLNDQSMYEIDVVPIIQQSNDVYPGNKMHWKYFELESFAKHN